MAFDFDQPPEDLEGLRHYVYQHFQRLAEMVNAAEDGAQLKTNVAPSKPRDGHLKYADGVNWNPGEGEGFYWFDGASWRFLCDLAALLARVNVWSAAQTFAADGNVANGAFEFNDNVQLDADLKLSGSSGFRGQVLRRGAALPEWGGALVPRRQTVLAGATDSNSQANFLSAGAGLNVNLAATATPVVLTFADGFNSSGPVDYLETISADIASAWAVPASSLSFLYVERNPTTGALTRGSTLTPSQYGHIFDSTRHMLLHLDGVDGSTAFTDEYGNTGWTAVGNAQLDTAQFKFGSSSLLLDGTGDAIKYASPNHPMNSDAWTAEFFIRYNSLAVFSALITSRPDTASYGFTLQNSATTGQLRLYISTTGGSWDVASNVLGTKTNFVTGQWYHIRFVFTGTVYKVFVDGVLDISVTSSLRIYTTAGLAVGGNIDGSESVNGWVDEIRLSPFARDGGEAFSAPTQAFSKDELHWFNLATFKMLKGTPGAWTAIQRLFVGEVVAGAASISSVITYALMGKYTSALVAMPALSTRTVFNTNLGIVPREVRPRVVCVSRDIATGYLPGDELAVAMTWSSGSFERLWTLPYTLEGRNVVSWQTSTHTQGMALPRNGGGSVGFSSYDNFKLGFIVDRGW